MEAIMFAAAILILFIGYIAAKIEYNKRLPSIKRKEYLAGLREGRNEAYADAEDVRKAYHYHFGNRN